MSSVQNVANCRACFVTNTDNISIFSYINVQEKRLCIKDLLLQYTQLQVLHTDLPTDICSQCVQHLENAHNFNAKCLETEKLLRNAILASEDTSIEKPKLGRKSKKKDIISDNYLSTKSPREIKILPKQNVSNAIVLNQTSPELCLPSPLIVLQNTETKPKNLGYELGLTRKGIFTCQLCPRQFVSAKYLRIHSESVHNAFSQSAQNRAFKCHACNLKFETKIKLLSHNMEMHFTPHNVRTKFVCKLCSKRFRNESYLAKHMSRIHADISIDNLAESMESTAQESSDEDIKRSLPIACKLCGKTFGFYRNYRIHKRIHEANVCLRCNKGFPKRDALLVHLKSHTKNNPFVCAYCGKVYMTRTALLAHYKSSYDIREKVYFCGMCDTITEVYLCHDNLVEHFLQHKEPHCTVPSVELIEDTADVKQETATAAVDVSEEGNVFKDTGVVGTESSETVHYIVVNSSDCGGEKYLEISAEQVEQLIRGELSEIDLMMTRQKLLSAEDNVELDPLNTAQHDTDENATLQLKTETDEDNQDISEANVDTNFDETNLAETDILETQKPNRPVSPSSAGKHKCSECGDVFTRKFNLSRHQAMAHKMFTMDCAYCPQKFNNMSLYDVHRFDCAKVNGFPKPGSKAAKPKKTYGGSVCPMCLEKFSRETHMLRHMSEQHSGDAVVNIERQEYHCLICGTKLMTSNGFSYHMHSHYGYPRHTCSICPRRFTSAVALRNHVTGKHTNHRPHLCTQCGRRFVTKDHLTKHLKLTHKRQRDFLCGVCGLTFQQSSHVQQHMWKHTGIKPHQCQFCPSRYSARTSLKKHLLRVHMEEYENEISKKESRYREMEMAEKARYRKSYTGVMETDGQTEYVELIEIDADDPQQMQEETLSDESVQDLDTLEVPASEQLQVVQGSSQELQVDSMLW